ncbi:hypothetical protein [Terrisporobacter hibernicus]|uniref:hypothetical protein n=1 Tax=Terrisporobacter hibernicus TaxID=2813371 RepID=UPI002F4213B2
MKIISIKIIIKCWLAKTEMNEQSKIQNKSITYNDLKFYIDVVGMLSWKQAKLVWSERTYHPIKDYFGKLT